MRTGSATWEPALTSTVPTRAARTETEPVPEPSSWTSGDESEAGPVTVSVTVLDGGPVMRICAATSRQARVGAVIAIRSWIVRPAAAATISAARAFTAGSSVGRAASP